MTELLVGFFIGIILIILGPLFFYRNIGEVKDHMNKYHEYKTKKALHFWYLEWPGLLLDTLVLNVPNTIISLIMFLIGLVLLIDVIKELL